MKQLTNRRNHPCWAEFECYYKVGDTCVYWEQVTATLSVLQEKYHKGASCYLNFIDDLEEPCRELDEEGRSRGIENLFK